MMKKGFTMVEMLVVIGIIAVLMTAGLVSYSKMTKNAQKARGQELVSNVATAIGVIYTDEKAFPRRLIQNAASGDGEFTAYVSYELAKRGVITLTYDSSSKVTTGLDRCGIVSPWAQQVIKTRGASASDTTKVPSGGTIADHRLHYAIDQDGDGYVDVKLGGNSLTIRGSVAVWCAGMDGVLETDYKKGLKSDDIYSWSYGQVKR